MQKATEEYSRKTKVVYDDIPEDEKPTPDDWKRINKKLAELDEGFTFDPDHGSLKCKNKYMDEEMRRNEQFLKDRKEMKKQVARMKMLREKGEI